MTPKRIAAKFFTSPDPTAPVELEPFIGIFHRFIQEQAVEGLLIDVADYMHVPDGPGVMLIGHDVDYGLDQVGGRAGLLTVRKRIEEGALSNHVVDTLRKSLLAMKAIEADDESGVRFATDAVELQLVDRLAAPNSDAGFASVKAEIEEAASRLFGDATAKCSRIDADDARRPLGVLVESSETADLETLIGRLGG